MNNVLKILSVGNSFSQDAHAYLAPVLASVGINALCYDLIIGGCSLERHAGNLVSGEKSYILEINGIEAVQHVSIQEATDVFDWDAITFQQASRHTGEKETFEPFLSELLSFFDEKSPRSVKYLHETWAYEKNAGTDWFERYGRNQDTMHNAIVEVFGFYSKKHSLPLIPCGHVIRMLRQTDTFDIDKGGIPLTRDGFHLNIPYGRYAVALTWARAIADVDPMNVSFIPDGADPAICKSIKKLVSGCDTAE